MVAVTVPGGEGTLLCAVQGGADRRYGFWCHFCPEKGI